MYRWLRGRVVGLDLENTGIDAARDRILMYGLIGVDADGDTAIDQWAMVDAESPTGRDPYGIPGVPPRVVANAVPIRDGHLDVFADVCAGATVVIHNAGYDWRFVEAEFKRHGHRPPVPARIVCTLTLAKHTLRLPGPHTLGELCARHGVPLPVAHNAEHDARAAFWLLMVLINKHPDRLPPDLGCYTRSKHWPPRQLRWADNLVPIYQRGRPTADVARIRARLNCYRHDRRGDPVAARPAPGAEDATNTNGITPGAHPPTASPRPS